MKHIRCFVTICFITVILFLMTACGHRVPSQYAQSDNYPKIYPDYVNVTVPVNIAPLSFQMDPKNEEMVVRYSVGDEEMVCGGEQACPSIGKWRQLTDKAKGAAIQVEVYARKDDQWTRFKPFQIFVSPDSIDPYISYRCIHPSFVTYEELTIRQRCLEDYDESVIYDNMLCGEELKGQCINCHHYQNYNPNRMQFHARQYHGGTLIAYDGKMKKVNMRNDSILSAGVYPAWHPSLNLIVYSTNKTFQGFLTTDKNKIEVYDTASDLILYDVERDEVTNIENDKDEMEVFPCWSPDGKTLYYCSAHFVLSDSIKDKNYEVLTRMNEVKYSIYKKEFDQQTKRFGPRQLVYDAAAMNMSATLPRVSPDGRYLMFTQGEHGVFHIWHHDADLWMIDLETGEARAMNELNSPDTESYHSWSSNGKWVVFSSRRDDGNFTRPFFTHIDANGKGTKPFELPSKNPNYHREFLKSYNVPEFMKGPVTITPQSIADILKKDDGVPVKYVSGLQAPSQ